MSSQPDHDNLRGKRQKKRYQTCIMATCVLPWDEHGAFMEDLFIHQVQTMLRGSHHLYIFGTAGEGYGVTDTQFARLAKIFTQVMRAAGAEPLVGVIHLSLAAIIERIELARELGIRQFQISLPSWGALTEQELFGFFRAVCGRFRDCTFLHYNLVRTKCLVTPTQYARLAEEHPNLVATKNSTDSIDRLDGLMTCAPELQHFFTEIGYAYARQAGECGLLASVATLNWAVCQDFFDAGRRADREALRPLQAEVSGLTRALTGAVGPGVHMDGAFDKMLWRMHDDRFPLRLLPPYSGASDEAFHHFLRVVQTQYPRWLPPERGQGTA